MNQVKDYYHILEVPSSATPEVIKQSFRKLAVKYHPDKNPDNSYSDSHFKEIQEAYSVLSNSHKRKKYDEVRWLAGMSDRVKRETHITPQWILQESNKLRSHMATVDTYRMSHRALHDFIMLLLSDNHLAILKKYNDEITNKHIIEELLKAIERLHVRYFETIAQRLLLVSNDTETEAIVSAQLIKRRRHEQRDKLLPWWIVIATFLLCLFMFLYGRK